MVATGRSRTSDEPSAVGDAEVEAGVAKQGRVAAPKLRVEVEQLIQGDPESSGDGLGVVVAPDGVAGWLTFVGDDRAARERARTGVLQGEPRIEVGDRPGDRGGGI